MAEKSFIDIPKGYRRLGSFPLDSGSVFVADDIAKAKAAAEKYASQGNSNGIAYKGQVLAVMSTNSEDDPQLYTVDNDFKLKALANSVTGSDALSSQFDYTTLSGQQLIKLPANFLLSQVTVTIETKFTLSNGNSPYFYYLDSNGKEVVLVDSTDVAFDEPGQYVIKMTRRISATTYVALSNATDSPAGSGVIKIN